MNVTLAASQFPPLALGFFGLGVGYLIWGPQELFGFPGRDERVDRRKMESGPALPQGRRGHSPWPFGGKQLECRSDRPHGFPVRRSRQVRWQLNESGKQMSGRK